MKSSLILAIICIGLGFAAGWIAKPAPNPEPEVATKDNPETKPTRTISTKTKDHPDSPRKRKSSLNSFVIGKDSKDLDPEAKKMAEQWSEMLKKKQKTKSDARLALLVDKLNLTPDQEAQLQAYFDKKLEGIGTMFSTDGDADPGALTAALKSDGLDELLAEILTPEQAEAHTELKKRERENKIEASALKSLAKLSFLDMSQDQKDAAYELLYEKAESSVDNSSQGSAMMSLMTSGMGIEIDTEDLGLSGIMDGQINGEAGVSDPADIVARMKESRERKINEKVEALRPVLDDKQLAQYRQHLESKNSGFIHEVMHDTIHIEAKEPAKNE